MATPENSPEDALRALTNKFEDLTASIASRDAQRDEEVSALNINKEALHRNRKDMESLEMSIEMAANNPGQFNRLYLGRALLAETRCSPPGPFCLRVATDESPFTTRSFGSR
jgi:hypothetical protein